MSEENDRFHSYRTSQSPQEREIRLRYNKVRMHLKRFSECSEIHEVRVESNKIAMTNLRDKSSKEIPAENIIVLEMLPKCLKKCWRRKFEFVSIERLNLH